MVGGHPVYSLWTEPGIGYRTRPGAAKGVAVGDQPESMYMVTSGEHYNDHCCFVRTPTLLSGSLDCPAS